VGWARGNHTVVAKGGQQRCQGPRPCSREGARGDDRQTDRQTYIHTVRPLYDDVCVQDLVKFCSSGAARASPRHRQRRPASDAVRCSTTVTQLVEASPGRSGHSRPAAGAPARRNTSASTAVKVDATTARQSDTSIHSDCPPFTPLRWCSGQDVALVIERSRVRVPAGALPGSLGQLSLPSLRGRNIEYQLTGWCKAGRIHVCRVTSKTV